MAVYERSLAEGIEASRRRSLGPNPKPKPKPEP
eukprot:CAMPEP_0118864406 /NCGR_PEP_ID=MMETSP1163-20130328/8999_1 /TAXON_ID=124430 /ORGANISM="Phaeomonas parva, Strain CCMP2877" /LENGTH=32 /DNA_ID= /DNA_START= /DNA_END= /DNA_ORIENTATION=